MKVDKRNPLHWIYLACFAAQGIAGLLLRLLCGSALPRPIILYGHKLNGNLLAIYNYLERREALEFRPVFLTMDYAYHRELQRRGVVSRWACSPGCALLLARAAIIISDHGLHSLQPLQRCYHKLGMRFVDVWHGIPFKGFDADDFRLQHRYDEVWVASPLLRTIYVERYGFDANRVVVTGYARTDRLVSQAEARKQICQRLGLPSERRLILFAPTWAQDAQGRSIYPFGRSESEFLGELSRLADANHATVLIRTHLNSGNGVVGQYQNVRYLPSDTYPDAEGILQVSDVLICDWSSIAFDYLLLNRPTFFLDVPPPFRKGFSLGPEYRFGAVVGTLQDLLSRIEAALSDPAAYWRECEDRHHLIRQDVYGEWADGNATERCVGRLSCL